MIHPLAGWLPMGLVVVSAGVLLWLGAREPKDPWKRYMDRLARADRDLQAALRKQRWAR